jgi:hypothetical protein
MGSGFASARGGFRAQFTGALPLALGWALGSPEAAHAFCRESLVSQSQGLCTEDPSVPALFWNRNCLTYTFNNQVFARVPSGEAFVRATFKASYQTWADVHTNPPQGVECGVRSDAPFLVAQAAAVSETTTSEFRYDQPNESIVVLRTPTEWASLDDHDRNALALTLLWHDKKTGEILDVDMELNGGAGSFGDCSTGCGGLRDGVDLQNTVTHEAGHLLGLGHSDVPGSTMQASTTRSGEITKRSLEADDEKGYCALDLPNGPCTGSRCACPAPPVFPSKRTSRGCSCSAPGEHTASDTAANASLAAAAVFLGTRARLRRRL